MMQQKEIIEKTEALIDDLRATCSNFGLAGDSSEYKILVQVFLYKYLNDKFGYEIKHANTDYKQRLNAAEHWEDAFLAMTNDEREDLQDFVPEAPRMKPEQAVIAVSEELKISRPLVSIHLPYSKGVNGLEEKSKNAIRCEKYRRRKAEKQKANNE